MRKIISFLQKSWRQNKGFLMINVTGLAIGLATSILLLVYVLNEWSYNRHLKNSDRIVQLLTEWKEGDNLTVYPINLRSAYNEIPAAIPGIEKAVQIYNGWQIELKRNNELFQNIDLLYADPEFFDVFQMEFVYGSPQNALTEPNQAILTRRQAEIIFGKANPVGETFNVGNAEYTVSAVVEAFPENTHVRFDMLAAMPQWAQNFGGLEFFTYYLLKQNTDMAETSRLIEATYTEILNKQFNKTGFRAEFSAYIEPLTRVHLFSKAQHGLSAQGNIYLVSALAGLSFLILLLAVTNFINLFLVQGNNRSLEVGIRKASGAGKGEIARQFFGEASVVVVVAFAVGLLAVYFLLPYFSQLVNRQITSSLLFTPLFMSGILALVLLTIFFSGFYPAFYLSRIKPVSTLKRGSSSRSKKRFTTAIVVFQSVITIVLLIVMLVINRQIDYLQKIPPGYNPKNVVMVVNPSRTIIEQYDALRQNLLAVSGIEMVSSAHHTVGGGGSGQSLKRYGSTEGSKHINEYRIQPGLCELMEFELVDGRFYREGDAQNPSYIVLNQEAVKMLELDDPVGKQVDMHQFPMEIIGVVKDFYYASPAEKVQPIALTMYNNYPGMIYIRMNPNIGKAEVKNIIEPVFKQIDPEFVMITSWADDVYNQHFETEQHVYKVVSISTLLSLLIAILGLFAIHSVLIARRIKEIGIRKIAGSTIGQIVAMLSNKIVVWILLAAVIAVPVGWIAGNRILQIHTNHISINLFILLIPVLIQLFIGLIATVVISYRAATQNPAETLRYE